MVQERVEVAWQSCTPASMWRCKECVPSVCAGSLVSGSRSISTFTRLKTCGCESHPVFAGVFAGSGYESAKLWLSLTPHSWLSHLCHSTPPHQGTHNSFFHCCKLRNICKHMHTACKTHSLFLLSLFVMLGHNHKYMTIFILSFFGFRGFFVCWILQWQIDELCFEHDTEPYAQERDAQIKVHISSCWRRFLFSDLQMKWFDDYPDHQRNVWSQICDIARRWFTDDLNTNGLMGVILITNCRNNHGTWDMGSSCFLICKPNGVMTILLITAGVITDLGHSKTIIHLRFESHKQLMQVLWF